MLATGAVLEWATLIGAVGALLSGLLGAWSSRRGLTRTEEGNKATVEVKHSVEGVKGKVEKLNGEGG